MCLICEKLENNKMTVREAHRNVMELRILDEVPTDHYEEILKLISEYQKKEDDDLVKKLFKNNN